MKEATIHCSQHRRFAPSCRRCYQLVKDVVSRIREVMEGCR